MQQDFKTIAILGGGLLGGSIALAAQSLNPAPRVRLWARRADTVSRAHEIGIANATDDLSEAVADADLCILCVPVGAMAELLTQAIACGLPDSSMVTDVGSVKTAPHRNLDPMMLARGACFIGSHPMAGSERKGIEAARVTLMENAACILTNDAHAPAEDTARIEAFWKSLGCRTSWMTADAHDRCVARISHLPHIVSASAARVCLRDPAEGAFGGGGLRDTTRIAGGDPVMWAEILMENRAALLGPMRETLADLAEILALLEAGDQEAVREWLDHARSLRASSPITT
ncbi:MAG: prephenate dehydrogenase [Luteolibacter sp.]